MMLAAKKFRSLVAGGVLLAVSGWYLFELHENAAAIGRDLLVLDPFNPASAARRAAVLTPNSDRLTFLAPQASAMIQLLEKHSLTTYRFSGRIAADPFISQRMVEGALPARFDPESEHCFFLPGEARPMRCVEIDQQGGVQLARCA